MANKNPTTSTMPPRLAQLYEQVRDLHAEIIAELVSVDAATRSSPDVQVLADTAYALREICTFTDDIGKKCGQSSRTAQNMAVMVHVAANADAEEGLPLIRTAHVTATADINTIVCIPSKKKNPEEYAKLLEYLKLPTEFWQNREHHVFDPYWPGLIDLLNQHQKEGKPLPPGIDPNKTGIERKLILRGRLAPNLEPEAAESENVF